MSTDRPHQATAAPLTPATRDEIDTYEAQVKRDLCRDIGHRIADNGLLEWCLRCDYTERKSA